MHSINFEWSQAKAKINLVEHEISFDEAKTVFFDEIQLFDKWDRFIRRLHDKISKHIFLTGSNAKLLSRQWEINGTGRLSSIATPIWRNFFL